MQQHGGRQLKFVTHEFEDVLDRDRSNVLMVKLVTCACCLDVVVLEPILVANVSHRLEVLTCIYMLPFRPFRVCICKEEGIKAN